MSMATKAGRQSVVVELFVVDEMGLEGKFFYFR